MLINLDELNIKNIIEFNYEVKKDDDLDKRIIDLVDCYCTGNIKRDSLDNYILEAKLEGKMIIEDSISLEPVAYNFSTLIEENVEEIQEMSETNQNILDLKRILWQNIVLEVPISFTMVKDAKLKGNGWELIQEEKLDDEIDPRLEKLKDLLKGDD